MATVAADGFCPALIDDNFRLSLRLHIAGFELIGVLQGAHQAVGFHAAQIGVGQMVGNLEGDLFSLLRTIGEWFIVLLD